MGLYQDTITLFNQTITTAASFNSPAFSAANFMGGAVSITEYGTVAGTTPTVALQLQVSCDGGVTWVNAPSTSNSLSDALTVTSATPATNGIVAKATTGTVYGGNLLRVVLTTTGTSLSIPVKVFLDAHKSFPDNA